MPEPKTTDDWRQLLRNAFTLRAAAYAEFYRAMREALGPDEALRLGQLATRRLGESIGPIPTFYLTAEFDLGLRVSAPGASHPVAYGAR